MNDKCENCDYVKRDGDVARCHAFPPAPGVSARVIRWPEVPLDGWCGHHSESQGVDTDHDPE